jgi:hypothetical protein
MTVSKNTLKYLLTRATLLTIASVIIGQGCKTPNRSAGKSNKADTTAVTTQPGKGSLRLAFTKSKEASLTAAATGNETLTGIMITIKDSAGAVVCEDREIALIKLGDSYITAPVDFAPGTFTIEKFSVLEDKNVIYGTPLKDTPRADLVSAPLPVQLTVTKDDVATATLDVIDVYEAVAADFGYSSFDVGIKKTFEFLATASALNPDTTDVEYVTAHITVNGFSKAYYSGDLETQINPIKINDQPDNFVLTVTKPGYSTVAKTMTVDELRTYTSGQVLDFALTPTGVPLYPPKSLAFTDTSMAAKQVGGKVLIGRAANELNLTHYVLYWGTNATTKRGATPIAIIPKTGANEITYTLPSTVIPAAPNATHLIVYSKNAFGEFPTGVSVPVSDLIAPVHKATFVQFIDWDTTKGEVAGNIYVTRAANETNVTGYAIYWGTSPTQKQNPTPIAVLGKSPRTMSYNIPTNTKIPTGPTALYLLIYTRNGAAEMPTGISLKFVDR